MINKDFQGPYGLTLTGKVRTVNEDSFLYTDERNHPNNLAVIADGIGGNIHGEIASRLCCQYFYEIWEEQKAMFINDVKEMEHFMRRTLDIVNTRIFEKNAQTDMLDNPMGTTVVAAAIMPKDIVVIHVGDSRFYEYRNGKITCLTVDHTLIQQNKDLLLNDQNIFPPEYELLNLITKSVGTGASIEDDDPQAPLINVTKLRQDSRYLLCSDGLSHMVDNNRIATIIKNSTNNKNAVNKLVAACFSSGAADNISIILI